MYSADDLLKSIKTRGIIPADDNTINDDDILRFANEELMLSIAPLVRAYGEEYFVNTEDYSLLSGKTSYVLPYRAMGNLVRKVSFHRSEENVEDVPRASIGQINQMKRYGRTGNTKYVYYLEDDKVKIYPKPDTEGFLRIHFFFRPNLLISSSKAGKIISIDRNTNSVEVALMPTNLIGTKLDLIKHNPLFSVLDWDLTPSNISGSVITFTDALPENLEVGDVVCEAQYTLYPQVMPELHAMLAQTVVCRILEALTHTEGLKNAKEKLKEMKEELPNLLGNRTPGSSLSLGFGPGFLDYSRRS